MNHPNRGHRTAASNPLPATIKAVRLAAGWTQRQCADALYVTVNGYQKWESGERPMPPGLFELLAIKIRTSAPAS